MLYDVDVPKDLISKLLVVDPKRRLTVDEALKHEFFQVLVSYMLGIIFVELSNSVVSVIRFLPRSCRFWSPLLFFSAFG